jgi:Zn-dependent protease with chaperone function
LEANTITLPGGHIYVSKGLVREARTPDELAGIIAYEFGHVAHRDGHETIMQDAGIALLFGMPLGDFVGGGAVVVAAKTLLRTSYSRGCG